MPFTLAHPAVVAPLLRRSGPTRFGIVPGAVAAGAVAPDLGWYLPPWLGIEVPSGTLTHSLLGALTVDLVVGLTAYVVWRLVVRRPLLALLPDPWRTAALDATRSVAPGRGPAAAVGLVVVSLVLGTLSHVALDVITHDSTATPAPLLHAAVAGRSWADVLQVALSVLGLIVLGWLLVAWLRGVARPLGPLARWRPMLLMLTAVAVASGLGAVERLAVTDPTGAFGFVSAALFGAGWWASVVVLGYAGAWWLLRLSRRRGRPAAPATSPDAPPVSRTPG